MSAPRPAPVRALVAGTVLVLAGLACWALHAVQARSESRSYTTAGNPPEYVHLVAGRTYWLAVPGGVKRVAQLGVQPSALQCTAAAAGQAPGSLSVVAQQNDTKATNQIASFSSGLTGDVHVECAGLGAVYVDGAGGFDFSGMWLLLASIALAIGIPLTLSGLRSAPGSGRRPAAEYDDLRDDEHLVAEDT